jgi:hypothetical protein
MRLPEFHPLVNRLCISPLASYWSAPYFRSAGAFARFGLEIRSIGTRSLASYRIMCFPLLFACRWLGSESSHLALGRLLVVPRLDRWTSCLFEDGSRSRRGHICLSFIHLRRQLAALPARRGMQ